MSSFVLKNILLPFFGTALGSACVFFMKKEMNEKLEKSLLGFASGVMIAASIWSLILPAIERSNHLGSFSFVPAITGLWLGVIAMLIIDKTIPEPHMETAEEKAARLSGKAKKDPHGPMSFRHFVLGAIAIFFYVGVEVGIPNTANLYMSGLEGVGPVVAGTLVGFYWFCMMLGRLLGGAIGAKVSSKQMLTFANILAIVFVLCLMFIPESVRMSIPGVDAQVPVSMVFMFLCGLCTSVMFGSIFNLAAEGLGKYTPVASGIFMALICGGGILPFIQGLVADAAGFINSYWVVIIGLAYMLFYAVAGSKNVNKDIPVE